MKKGLRENSHLLGQSGPALGARWRGWPQLLAPGWAPLLSKSRWPVSAREAAGRSQVGKGPLRLCLRLPPGFQV